MLQWRKKNERGSVEIVLLVLVLAVAVGLVAWRIAETQNAQTDAEHSAAMAENAPDVKAKYVTVTELGFKFLNPTDAGELTYKINGKAGEQYARVSSSKLKAATYTCKGENLGEVGTIHVMPKDGDMSGMEPGQLTKIVGEKEYSFYTALQTTCYEPAVQKQFRDTVPKAVMDSIREVK